MNGPLHGPIIRQYFLSSDYGIWYWMIGYLASGALAVFESWSLQGEARNTGDANAILDWRLQQTSNEVFDFITLL